MIQNSFKLCFYVCVDAVCGCVRVCVTFILFHFTGVIVSLGVNHQLKEIHSTLKDDIYENSFDYISESADTHTVYVHTHVHKLPYLFLGGLSTRLDLLQCSVKEVSDRHREKGKLQLLKNRTHKGEESWN